MSEHGPRASAFTNLPATAWMSAFWQPWSALNSWNVFVGGLWSHWLEAAASMTNPWLHGLPDGQACRPRASDSMLPWSSRTAAMAGTVAAAPSAANTASPRRDDDVRTQPLADSPRGAAAVPPVQLLTGETPAASPPAARTDHVKPAMPAEADVSTAVPPAGTDTKHAAASDGKGSRSPARKRPQPPGGKSSTPARPASHVAKKTGTRKTKPPKAP